MLRLNIKKKYSVPVFSIATVALLGSARLGSALLCSSCCLLHLSLVLIVLLSSLQSVQYARMHSAAALEVNIRIAAQCRLERRVQIRFVGSYKHACRMEKRKEEDAKGRQGLE